MNNIEKLEIAFKSKDISTILKLLKNDNNYDLAINNAARYECLEVVEFLVNKKNVSARSCKSAFKEAVQSGSISIVKFLLKYGKKNNTSFLNLAAKNGHFSIVDFLMKNGYQYDYNIIIEATKWDQIELVQQLIEKKKYICYDLIFEAVQNGHLTLCKWLIDNKQEKMSYSDISNLVKYAAKNDHLSIIEYLSQLYTPLIDFDPSSAFFHAAENGHESIVDIFLPYKDTYKEQEYHWIVDKVIKNGSLKIFKIIFNEVDNNDQDYIIMLFHSSVEYGSVDIAKYLFEKVNEENIIHIQDGIVYSAFKSESLEMIHFVLNLEIINNSNFKTPLFCMIYCNNFRIFRYIFETFNDKFSSISVLEYLVKCITKETNIEIVRYLSLYSDDFQSKDTFSKEFNSYIEKFKKNPEKMRMKVKLSYRPKLRWYTLLVLLSDNFLRLSKKKNNLKRFAYIGKQLPQELQIKIVQLIGNDYENLNGNVFNEYYSTLIKHYL